MKFKGTPLVNNREEFVVIPRDGFDVVFTVKPVLTFDEFDKIIKRPEPPVITNADGTQFFDEDDEKYKEKLVDFAQKRSAWLILTSLKDTKDIEWETVKENEPETWVNWLDELRTAQFSEREILKITETVSNVNGFNDDQMEAARKRFLAMRLQVENHN